MSEAEDDPWAVTVRSPVEPAAQDLGSGAAFGLSFQTHDGVVPFQTAPGHADTAHVPPVLQHSLFGQTPDASMRQTFALLDGARAVDLPELLGQSGLRHACLFTGEAFEDLSGVAPWPGFVSQMV